MMTEAEEEKDEVAEEAKSLARRSRARLPRRSYRGVLSHRHTVLDSSDEFL